MSDDDVLWSVEDDDSFLTDEDTATDEDTKLHAHGRSDPSRSRSQQARSGNEDIGSNRPSETDLALAISLVVPSAPTLRPRARWNERSAT